MTRASSGDSFDGIVVAARWNSTMSWYSTGVAFRATRS